MTDDLERFLAHVDRAGSVVPGMNLRCWKWTGAVDRDGRPRFRLGGRSMLAKRALLEILAGGKFPGHAVGQLCRNPLCVRPDHVVPCNEIDARALGRWGTLDPGQVFLVRKLHADGFTVAELAVVCEVSVPLIQAIIEEGQ